MWPEAAAAPGGSSGSAGARHASTGRPHGAPGDQGLKGGGVQPIPRAAGALQVLRPREAPMAAGEGVLGVLGHSTPTQLAFGSPGCPVPWRCRVPESRGIGTRGVHRAGEDPPSPGGASAVVAGPPRLGSPAPQVASGQHLSSCFVHFLISCRAGQRL